MNGTCAGGTGAFIDQMAALLDTDAGGLNELAANATTIYPIASRCGVFRQDRRSAASQRRRPSRGRRRFHLPGRRDPDHLGSGVRPSHSWQHVALLGGPLQYLSELDKRFCETLNLDNEHRIFPEERPPVRRERRRFGGKNNRHARAACRQLIERPRMA